MPSGNGEIGHCRHRIGDTDTMDGDLTQDAFVACDGRGGIIAFVIVQNVDLGLRMDISTPHTAWPGDGSMPASAH